MESVLRTSTLPVVCLLVVHYVAGIHGAAACDSPHVDNERPVNVTEEEYAKYCCSAIKKRFIQLNLPVRLCLGRRVLRRSRRAVLLWKHILSCAGFMLCGICHGLFVLRIHDQRVLLSQVRR
ncbi:uncharacterized protein LOC124258667 isoform X4 [Haliotis rubra]|uniref:uncharacterized protein LOC124258667 isoform X4 n=1 Tax=Haliotis rubra TaxID=36100 RepID=UPI001EE552FB|nr:uncharacterized protein LOC124258667 isoform X4 [Haliotis rubra]